MQSELLASAVGTVIANVAVIAYGYGKLSQRIEGIDRNGSAFVREKIESIEKGIASLQTSDALKAQSLEHIKESLKDLSERLQNAELHRNRSAKTA